LSPGGHGTPPQPSKQSESQDLSQTSTTTQTPKTTQTLKKLDPRNDPSNLQYWVPQPQEEERPYQDWLWENLKDEISRRGIKALSQTGIGMVLTLEEDDKRAGKTSLNPLSLDDNDQGKQNPLLIPDDDKGPGKKKWETNKNAGV
jgi:hypothetical protein